MVSLRCPTSREKLELVSEPAETSTLRCVVLKPANETATRYVPMGRSLMRKPPVSLVVAVRITLVPRFCALTATLGTTAAELSVTTPAISPVIFCAKTGQARHRLTRSRKHNPRLKAKSLRIGSPSVTSTCTITLLGGSLVGPRRNYQEQFAAHNRGCMTPLT